ncbi:MAG: hypothetical protein QM533_05295 [Cytophagales bacterium]|nr:hypothetical protein [Cytophagales bacterium]
MSITFYQALVDAQISPAAAHAVSEALRNDVQQLSAEHQKNLMTQADGEKIRTEIANVKTDIANVKTDIANVKTDIVKHLNDLVLKLVAICVATVAAFKLIPSLHT